MTAPFHREPEVRHVIMIRRPDESWEEHDKGDDHSTIGARLEEYRDFIKQHYDYPIQTCAVKVTTTYAIAEERVQCPFCCGHFTRVIGDKDECPKCRPDGTDDRDRWGDGSKALDPNDDLEPKEHDEE